jgi:hypothetical protein
MKLQIQESTHGANVGIRLYAENDGGTAQDGHIIFDPDAVFFGLSKGGTTINLGVDSAGRVGIGLTDPGHLLDVTAADGASDNNPVARFVNAETTNGRSKGVYIRAGSTNDDFGLQIDDHDASATLLRFTGAGRMGFNTIAPNAKIDIRETTNGQELIFLNHSDTSTDQTYIQFRHDGTQRGNIQVNNSTDQIVYNTSVSDKRLKKDFEEWDESVLPAFKSLKPQLFNFINSENKSGKRKGYMAQDNVDNFPEAYTTSKILDDETEYYSFNPSGMVAYLMKAVQELSEKIEHIEKTCKCMKEG